MIARLKGILDEKGEEWIVVDVGGVGYLVFCPARTIGALPAPGAPVTLHIETHVREDHIHLYGFSEVRERACFRLLTTVQGVGAKVALAILGVMGVDQFVNAILAQDKAQLTRADGVGPRLAARLLTELKDRILTLDVAAGFVAAAAPAADGGGDADGEAQPMPGDDTLAGDAVSALVNLGYGRAEAFGAVAAVSRRADAPRELDALIPAALKELSQ